MSNEYNMVLLHPHIGHRAQPEENYTTVLIASQFHATQFQFYSHCFLNTACHPLLLSVSSSPIPLSNYLDLHYSQVLPHAINS